MTRSSPSPTDLLPPRPVKQSVPVVAKKGKKPPMPLPTEQQSCTCRPNQAGNRNSSGSGPYDNYDVPKTILGHHMSFEPSPPPSADQYYDTPRKIKECLALPKTYPNYDTPHIPQAVVLQQCGCPAKMPAQSPRSTTCPCHNVMSWAGFVLPYCRRGAGIEATGVNVQPVKLSGEGKMPVVNASGELAIYASKTNDQLEERKNTASVRKENCECESKSSMSNYENVAPVIDTQPESAKSANYANIDFTESLEYYENSKDLIAKAGITRNEIEEIADQLEKASNEKEAEDAENKVCAKCGHVKDIVGSDYLMMEPEKQLVKKPFAGYLTMQPAAATSSSSSSSSPVPSPHNACSKEILSRICNSGVKSSSNPTLFGSSTPEAIRKRSDSEFRVPGSAMLSSPYLRRRLIDPTGSLEAPGNLGMLWRKRSYSAESAHYLDEPNPGFSSNLTIHKCPSDIEKTSVMKDRQSPHCANSQLKINTENECGTAGQPFSIKIRRSSSVPSKTGHNRDSSSSNDSGVSTGSLSHRNAEFVEFELSLAPISSSRKQNILTVCRKSPPPVCFHNSLPRKSKSSDPLRELSFQFQKIKVPTKSSSTEGDIPICLPKNTKGFGSPNEVTGTPYIDSRSTSSGTSDMSDYIETLSLSSHSSSDTPDNLRLAKKTKNKTKTIHFYSQE